MPRNYERLLRLIPNPMTLSDYTFECHDCGSETRMSHYCIAQLAQGVELIYNCQCGSEINLNKNNLDD